MHLFFKEERLLSSRKRNKSMAMAMGCQEYIDKHLLFFCLVSELTGERKVTTFSSNAPRKDDTWKKLGFSEASRRLFRAAVGGSWLPSCTTPRFKVEGTEAQINEDTCPTSHNQLE